jgi:hypothetical protein
LRVASPAAAATPTEMLAKGAARVPGFVLLPAVLTKNDFDASPSMPSQFTSAVRTLGRVGGAGVTAALPSLQSSALVTRPATATHDSTKVGAVAETVGVDVCEPPAAVEAVAERGS